MQTTTGGVAVVTTTLAQTDRRALSQAWYSALHLAEQTKATAGKAARGAVIAGRESPRAAVHHTAPGPRLCTDARRVQQRIAAARPPGLAPERRLPPGGLSRRIAKLIADRAVARDAARAQSVSIRGGRVHVIVRTHGSATRIVALCPPPLEARVARALAQARFALAASGMRVEAGA